MKNIPIAIGFAVITMTQCVLGICLTILIARTGGEVICLGRGNRAHSEYRCALLQLFLCSPTAAGTPGCILPVRIYSEL